MKRRIFPLFLIIVFFLCGCAETQNSSYGDDGLTTLKMTISDNLSYAPIFIAEEEGLFTKYGIAIEYVTMTKAAEAIAMLSSGKIDVYAGTLNTGLLNALREDNKMKVVADRGHTQPGTCTYQAIVIRKELADSGQVSGPADLKGLTFSATTAGPAAYLLSTYLAQGGLTFDNIEMLDLPTISEIDGYDTGSLDGSIAPEPDLTRLLRTGDVSILATAEDVLGTFQSGVIAFNDSLLEESPDLGARFMAAYLEGVRQYNQGKTDRNVQIIADAIGENPEDVMDFCWVPIRDDGIIDFNSVDQFQQWSIAQEQLSEPITEEQFWNTSIIEQAMLLIADVQ
jgi:NitT/TauT family transport system substrate-binding protein